MKYIKIIAIFFFAAVLVIQPELVKAYDAVQLTNIAPKPWSVLLGYGITHNGLGKTQINVETIDFVVGYENFLTDTFGPSFLKGRHSFVIEVPVHFVVDPWEDPMIGMNFLARWTFENNHEIKPYIFAGGGPVYTGANIQGLGSELNGNWQFGGGIHFPAFNNNYLVFEYRFHHISNMNTKDPNDSLNSSKVLLGFRF